MKKPNFGNVEEFLANRHLFDLGVLPTEQQNPKTENLSEWVEKDLSRAIDAVREVDQDALSKLAEFGEPFSRLSREIQETLSSGNKIFLCGCGATGRLSLALESIWRADAEARRGFPEDAVVGFMAGGDIALVRSVENFEDMPAFGARQLLGLGFQKGDLLLSPTEGGETPFVIGATEEAARIAKEEGGRKPYFLYCNPRDILIQHVERSKKIIESPWVHELSIPTGPMALSGSTRLQASTVLMYGIGLAMSHKNLSAKDFFGKVDRFQEFLEKMSWDFLPAFTEFEARVVKEGNYLIYETDVFGITILTDTTERSPTFSLRPFENLNDPSTVKPCLSYLCIPSTASSKDAWKKILGRLPRGLNWEGYEARLSSSVALGFDFSSHGAAQRKKRVAPKALEKIQIFSEPDGLSIRYAQTKALVPLRDGAHELTPLEKHLVLKLILNMHSLFEMGRLGRYEKNVMTWVRPSNGKLIDRSIRYVRYLLKQKGRELSYEELAAHLFQIYPTLTEDEPIVVHMVNKILKEKGNDSRH